ncbi:AraC family transcriptional regulator [Microbacterium barkeri]|uniref:AraC family transcriptional regulator n=1 Tax=Microbacterium barkeri TaxID=33917 RepID=A0A9W6LX37_9MICO|nr:GyrI-like domain-containing protein [Microbacterium barkeri]MDR6877502.1 AraC family transcriptional regulator [Microbacterium barkeri]GLJ62439.1 AraC family transcriptional regulator [Microbacterium barkeri]
MIAALNDLIDAVERTPDDEIDVAAVAHAHGTTEHHLRRMFSSLAGMPVSEYVRRRRMTLAAADVAESSGDLLAIAVRYGYGSTEAFARAFRSVHGVGPSEARRDGGPFRSQQQLRFRLTVEGSTPMHVRLIEHPALRLVGHATRVPLIHEGVNPHIQEHIARIPMEEHVRLKALGDTEPAGILQVTDDIEQDSAEGSDLTYLHGVAISDDVDAPDDLDAIAVPAGSWAVFTSDGPHPKALQDMWAATAAEWFPSNPWRLRPGPSIVAVLEHDAAFTHARCELWLPVERA